jgi:hypothetical protein
MAAAFMPQRIAVTRMRRHAAVIADVNSSWLVIIAAN